MSNRFINSPKDLQTKHEAITKGFLEQATQKTEKAVPYTEKARAFYKALMSVNSIEEIIDLKEFRTDLMAACGFSDKARAKLTDQELDEVIEKVLNDIYSVAQQDFREEILYRYLLTKGDSLGGSMRNLTGATAGNKLVNAIAERLKNAGHEIYLAKTTSNKVRRIAWGNRVMRFDVTPGIIKKNIDVILLSSNKENDESADRILLEDRGSYVACGELKGGIDPAGADEHWKTANSALGRIRTAFKKPPALFFAGASIEAAMAVEIFEQLKDGRLAMAANITDENQFDELVNWLINL